MLNPMEFGGFAIRRFAFLIWVSADLQSAALPFLTS